MHCSNRIITGGFRDDCEYDQRQLMQHQHHANSREWTKVRPSISHTCHFQESTVSISHTCHFQESTVWYRMSYCGTKQCFSFQKTNIFCPENSSCPSGTILIKFGWYWYSFRPLSLILARRVLRFKTEIPFDFQSFLEISRTSSHHFLDKPKKK